MKILIIEDSERQISTYEKEFIGEDYLYEKATTHQQAMETISLYEYDCILIAYSKDRVGVTGILQFLEKSNRPEGIIILSSNTNIADKVEMLNMGVDDYLTIPFHFEELSARIKAVIRRKKFHTKNKLYFANLIVEFETRTVFVWSNPVNFTRKEYEIFLYLIAHKSKVVSKIALAEYLWGNETDQMDSFNIVSAHIKNIRKKLKEAKAEVEIKNNYGVGYQIIEL